MDVDKELFWKHLTTEVGHCDSCRHVRDCPATRRISCAGYMRWLENYDDKSLIDFAVGEHRVVCGIDDWWEPIPEPPPSKND